MVHRCVNIFLIYRPELYNLRIQKMKKICLQGPVYM